MEFLLFLPKAQMVLKANKKKRSTERLIAITFSGRISGVFFCFIRNNIQDVMKLCVVKERNEKANLFDSKFDAIES